MNYTDKKVFITGSRGFLGKAIAARLKELDADVYEYEGDVRDKQRLTELLTHKWDYVFHFGCPSSQVLFQRNRRYCIETTVHSFMILSRLCALNGIRLVYPSTGLLSQGRSNEYARCKQICEDLAATPDLDSLGLRIFATYGPGEAHKRDYASVPYLFARDVIKGKRPVIWGDGEQSRDFIYIDDVVEATLILAEECPDKLIDIGSGRMVTFNNVIRSIDQLSGLQASPQYIEAPAGYVMETEANTNRLLDFYEPVVGFNAGIAKMIDYIKQREV
jgi:UDP-glucose 4-epimerase